MLKLVVALAICLAGCYLKSYPVTVQVAEASSYELFAGDYQGTAWAVSDHELVTAGHMCESTSPGPYVAVSSTGRRLLATPVAWELSGPGANPQSDMCLLRTTAGLATPLILATRLPNIGEAVGYVGWPLGVLSKGTGHYLGDVDGPTAAGDYTFSAPIDHGASGSALFISEGVVGVVVRLRQDGHKEHDGTDGGVMTPITLLRPFLDDMHVSYQLTPEPLQDMPATQE